MVSLDKAVIVKYKHGEHSFEIYADPDLALNLRHGQQVSFNDLLASDEVFKDAKKGELASEHLLKKVFGTLEVNEIAAKIIKDGELHLTTEQRRKLTEETRKRVISLIASKAVDPKTKTPHPPQRIELALDQAKFHVDPSKTAEQQVSEAIEKLKPILQISIEVLKMEVRIPPEYASKAYGTLKKYDVKQEQWLNDGSLKVVVEMPAGTRDKFISDVQGIAHGNAESRIL